MFVKLVKIQNQIYKNAQLVNSVPVEFDENGEPTKFEEKWIIPTDIDQLKLVIIDTLGFMFTEKLKQLIPTSIDKKDASYSKSICLLAKVINTLNPDLSSLTEKEQSAFQKMLDLANTGYTDSDLLNNTISSISSTLTWYNQKVTELNNLTEFDDLVDFLCGL